MIDRYSLLADRPGALSIHARCRLGAALLMISGLPLAQAGGLGLLSPTPLSLAASTSKSPTIARFADFAEAQASPDARHIADWIADSRNNAGLDFLIVDKKSAHLYVFDSDARLRGSTPVLLGTARGDDSAPGIGTRPLAEVLLEERTTPAGRFMGERGRNLRDEDVVWVDYDAAVSMHRVLMTNPEERRLQRLATPTASDNRISYGCINVPVAFYERAVRPTFATRRALVYVLPEVRSLEAVFGSYDVAKMHSLLSTRAHAESLGAAADRGTSD